MTLDPWKSDEELRRLASARTVQEQGASPEQPATQHTARSKSSRMVMPAKGRMAERPAFSSVQIVVPFAYLHADNSKYIVMKNQRRLVLAPGYRQAKSRIGEIARRAMQTMQSTTEDVTVHAKLYMPDARRRDATNYAKCLNDSLEGAVYVDDTQIKSATYENAGIDRENPRVEITVRVK